MTAAEGPISQRLKTLLQDALVDYTLREIDDFFGDTQVPFVAVPGFSGGQRRARTVGFLNRLDLSDPRDVRRFLDALANFLREEDRRHQVELDSRWSWKAKDEPPPPHPSAKLLAELKRCGYEWKDGAVQAVSASARLADAKAYAEAFELSHLGDHVQRIERSIESDPAQAIGSAKELLETVAKTLLAKRGVAFGPGDDALQLGRALFKELRQLPADVPESAKGAEVIKRMLSNLGSVVQGVAELRGLYGTGHGKDGKARGLQPRHARLVVGAAAALAFYWVETEREMG